MDYKKEVERFLREFQKSEKSSHRLQLEELNVYKLADEVSDKIWKLVSDWRPFSKNTIGEQMVRSADSIVANIAEGYGRYFFKDNIVFLYYSRGSAYETKLWVEKAYKRDLIKEKEFKELKKAIEKLILELNKLIKTIKKQIDKFIVVPWYRYKPKSK